MVPINIYTIIITYFFDFFGIIAIIYLKYYCQGKSMLDKFKDYFDLMFNENRLAHSFLIGNVLFDDIKNDLNEVIKKIFNNDNLNIESNPDIYILKNDDSIISKDDIKNLLEEISTTSQFNNNKVCRIDGV